MSTRTNLQTVCIGAIVLGCMISTFVASPLESRTTEESDDANRVQNPETCQDRFTTLHVGYPGCSSQSVVTVACRGTCRSRTVPEWDQEREILHMVEHCTCCKPMLIRRVRITLDCPFLSSTTRRRVTRNIWVSMACQCHCRPCSHAKPQAQKPYDY